MTNEVNIHELDWTPVQSSNLEAVNYSAAALLVAFKSGDVWQYDSVPQDVYDRLMAVGSKGAYFHEHIKGKYTSTKLEQRFEDEGPLNEGVADDKTDEGNASESQTEESGGTAAEPTGQDGEEEAGNSTNGEATGSQTDAPAPQGQSEGGSSVDEQAVRLTALQDKFKANRWANREGQDGGVAFDDLEISLFKGEDGNEHIVTGTVSQLEAMIVDANGHPHPMEGQRSQPQELHDAAGQAPAGEDAAGTQEGDSGSSEQEESGQRDESAGEEGAESEKAAA